jgi:hypothetical protein
MHEVVNLWIWCLKHDAQGVARVMLDGGLTSTNLQYSATTAPCLDRPSKQEA